MDEACYLSADETVRSLADIIGKTLTIHIFPLAMFGHYMSLCGVPSTKLSVALLFSFLGSPLSYAYLFLFRVLKLVVRRICQRRVQGDWAYYLSACFGAWAVFVDPTTGSRSPNREKPDAIPLIFVDFNDVQRTSEEYNKKWFGRLGVILTILVQAIATSVLYVRRVKSNACAHIDIINGTIGLGTSFIQVSSLVIHILNFTWQVSTDAWSVKRRRHYLHYEDEQSKENEVNGESEGSEMVALASSSQDGPSQGAGLRQRRQRRLTETRRKARLEDVVAPVKLFHWRSPELVRLEVSVESDLVNELAVALALSLIYHFQVLYWIDGILGSIRAEAYGGTVYMVLFLAILLIIPVLHIIFCVILELGSSAALPSSWKVYAYDWSQSGAAFGWCLFALMMCCISYVSIFTGISVGYKDFGRALNPFYLNPFLREALGADSGPPCNRTYWKDPLAELLVVF